MTNPKASDPLGLAAGRRALVRRSGRADRRHAPHPGGGETLGLREPVPARPELLHAPARPRGAAARHLHRLADAPHARRRHGRGLFILPGIFSIMALSWIYALYGKVGIVSALFFGLKAAVLAIVLQAVVRIGSKALKNNVLAGLAAAAFVGIFFFDVPFPLIILAASLI